MTKENEQTLEVCFTMAELFEWTSGSFSGNT